MCISMRKGKPIKGIFSKWLPGVLLLVSAFSNFAASAQEPRLEENRTMKLWYRQPATKWVEALPVGNGRLGGMVFGGVPEERIQLNEDSVWSGGPQDADNPQALEALPEIRRLLFAGKYAEAEKLTFQRLVCKGEGSGRGRGSKVPFGCYQTLGDLKLKLDGDALAADYRRELDLDTAIARVHYRSGDATFTREVFSSAPDQALVVRLTCDRPGRVSFTATLTREECAATQAEGVDNSSCRPSCGPARARTG